MVQRVSTAATGVAKTAPASGLLLTLLLAGLLLAACSRKSGDGAAAGAPGGGAAQALPVEVQVAQLRPVQDFTEYVATLKSRGQTTVSPDVEGILTQILVHSGEQVRAGQPLMQIQPDAQQAAVNAAESSVRAQQATVKLAEVDLHRNEALYAARVISRQALDNSRSAYDSAVAQLKMLQAQARQQGVQLRYYRVTALRSGMVGDVPVRVGDRVTNTTVLTTLVTPGELEAYIYVPVEQSPRLKKGLAVELLNDSGAAAVHTAINFIAPQVDATTQTVLAKAPVGARANLRSDQYVRAHVIWGMHQAVLAPVLAVARINGRTFAFVAEKQGKGYVARQKPIDIGRITGNDYEVNSGLNAGDQMIVGGTQFLADGMPVAPMPARPGGAPPGAGTP